jgi:hypothetical protein
MSFFQLAKNIITYTMLGNGIPISKFPREPIPKLISAKIS